MKWLLLFPATRLHECGHHHIDNKGFIGFQPSVNLHSAVYACWRNDGTLFRVDVHLRALTPSDGNKNPWKLSLHQTTEGQRAGSTPCANPAVTTPKTPTSG
jgi:hypothetical protein